jgi:hypothetical protein
MALRGGLGRRRLRRAALVRALSEHAAA